VQDVLCSLTQRPAHLLSFQQVSQRLQLGNVHDLGLQTVPLDLIVGSVERYYDFTRAFFPRQDHLRERWQRIEWLIASGRDLPPIELYLVGQVYFVRDGNHRVSVARQHGRSSIPAYVWAFETDVTLEPGSDIDQLLGQSARADFEERTQIGRLCPDLCIDLTRADGYAELLTEIEAFRQLLCEIDEREIPGDEAVTLWAVLRYRPTVAVIRERRALQRFPGRTEADLYLWLCTNVAELEAQYGHPVMMREAADDLADRFGQRPSRVYWIRQRAGWQMGIVVGRVAGWWRGVRRTANRGRPAKDRQRTE
jgi:hypothetical protein